METEVVTRRQWDNYAARIERKNLKERGHSLTRTAIAYRANSYIIEIREDTMIVRTGWREAMRNEDE